MGACAWVHDRVKHDGVIPPLLSPSRINAVIIKSLSRAVPARGYSNDCSEPLHQRGGTLGSCVSRVRGGSLPVDYGISLDDVLSDI